MTPPLCPLTPSSTAAIPFHPVLSLPHTERLVGQLADLRTRADVEHMITGEVRPHPFYEDTYKSEAEMVVRIKRGGVCVNPGLRFFSSA